MFKISLFTQVALVLAFGLGFPEFAHSQSPLQCSEIYEVSEAQALPPHPMSSAVQKLVIKKEMVLEFLDVFTGQTQRQVQKLGRQIEKIVEAFVRDQDLSESTINRLIELNEKMVGLLRHRHRFKKDPRQVPVTLTARKAVIQKNFGKYALDIMEHLRGIEMVLSFSTYPVGATIDDQGSNIQTTVDHVVNNFTKILGHSN